MRRILTTALIAGLAALVLFAACSGSTTKKPVQKKVKIEIDRNPSDEKAEDNKIVVYQMMVRLFGNKVTNNTVWGSKKENGVGKFNDINDAALKGLKELSISHVWFTGVLRHAVCADYRKYGIPLDDADVIKGRAGSPYAITDYYDVNPDLAVNPGKRLAEFEALIKRTHKHGLKVIIDFVPNHVARGAKSVMKPKGVRDLGQGDDTSKAFSPNNNFYYIPGQPFKVPKGNLTPGPNNSFPTKDGKFAESPAKVTGNDKFTASPHVNDWFETVKLNYGVDIQKGRKTHFKPIPSTWKQMRDIVIYWAKKDVDGMRCDMAEMVPVEFWAWMIPQVKKVNPDFIFIAEIYNPSAYRDYLFKGGFDYLYDKVGLYDTLKPLMQGSGDANRIYYSWRSFMTLSKGPGYASRMLRFLENHDEQRIASRGFAETPWAAVPAMTVSATLSSGPVMLYFGQEVGEKGDGREGFGGDDDRTTIFDYWGVPAHQAWMNGGRFDGGKLDKNQKKLRRFYVDLLSIATKNEAFRKGELYDLHFANEGGQSAGYNDRRLYAYIRYTAKQRMLVLVNFDKKRTIAPKIKIPQRAFKLMGIPASGSYTATDVLDKNFSISFKASAVTNRRDTGAGFSVKLKPWAAHVMELKAGK